jgi:hypothetical protein
VASGRASPSGIAADASNVYWVETGEGGSVASCAIAGCTSPTVLAAALGLLIVVDDANVYWTDGAEANSCPIGGCSAAPTILFKAAGATGIAIDAQNVYVTTDLRNIDSASGAVLSCAKTGCGGEPIALATGQSGPLPIAVSDGTVFWGNTQGDISLWGCATAGCMQTPTLITMAALPISLAADGPSLYWASLGAILYFPE